MNESALKQGLVNKPTNKQACLQTNIQTSKQTNIQITNKQTNKHTCTCKQQISKQIINKTKQ